MTTTRIMPGLSDLTGDKYGTLLVQRMVSRQPEPRYAVICERCSTTTTATHSRLRNGAVHCQFSGCGKPTKRGGRDLLSEQRHQIAERENQRRLDELAVSELRMAAEVNSLDWEKRDANRQADEERRDTRAQEAAEAAQRQRAESQRQYWAEAVQESPDPRLYVTPELLTAKMSKTAASAHNSAEVAKFIETTSDFAEYRTPQNADKLLAYLERNGVRIFDAAMLNAAFIRLRDLGILEKRPTPTPVRPTEQPRRVNLTIAQSTPEAPARPKMYRGRDYGTGLERDFSEREVNRMSSLEYQRAFAVAPTVSELFTAMSDAR